MSIMNTLRLSLTADLKEGLDLLRSTEYPTLTRAEVAKLAIGREVVRSRRKAKRVSDLDYSDPTPAELMRHAEYIFSLDEGDQYDQPFWDERKLKPFKPRVHV